MTGNVIAALIAISVLPLGACKRGGEEPVAPASDSASPTLASAVAGAEGLTKFAGALKAADLDGALNGAVPYTLLAPTDDAFAKLGVGAGEPKSQDQQEELAAMLREHILRGYLTPANLRASIAANQGKPITMRTTGETEVTFASNGDTLTIKSANGITATVSGQPVLAGNGAAIPIDTVLKKLPGS